MSKIDMGKIGAYKINSMVEPRLRNEKAESYLQYIEASGQLITKYKADIEFVEKMLVKLREERKKFFLEDLTVIKENLESEGIPQELAIEWIEEIKVNFNNSFEASEKILTDFSYVSIEEVKKKLEEIING